MTVYDFRGPVYNEATNNGVTGVDAQVCVGELPEGTSQVTWAPWSLIGPQNARYSELEPAGGMDMSPIYPEVTRVASGDCVRGWITFAVPIDTEISGIRYILGEDADNFAATFRPLPAPAPGQTRPEGCVLISDPNNEAASALWLKANADIEVRASYPDPKNHGSYLVARKTDGTVLTWWWFDRLYFERINGPEASNLPFPADEATFAVAKDFMETGRPYRPDISSAYETAKQCVA